MLADNPEVPSIWETALVQMLLSGPTPFSLTHLEQWHFGAKGVKPTTLLTANIDIKHLLQHMRCTWLLRPRYALIGRTNDGASYRCGQRVS